jgi:hypothetical protein
MVDLQRCMCVIWKIEGRRMQYTGENSDNDAFATSRFSETLLSHKVAREFSSARLGPDWAY